VQTPKKSIVSKSTISLSVGVGIFAILVMGFAYIRNGNSFSTSTVDASTPISQAAAIKGIKDNLTANNWVVKTTTFGSYGKSMKYNDFTNSTEASGFWLGFEVTVSNNDKQTRSLSTLDFEVHDSFGRVYPASPESAVYAAFNKQRSILDSVAPGASSKITVLFDVTTFQKLTLVFKPGFSRDELFVG
jgi:hypothetical protein